MPIARRNGGRIRNNSKTLSVSVTTKIARHSNKTLSDNVTNKIARRRNTSEGSAMTKIVRLRKMQDANKTTKIASCNNRVSASGLQHSDRNNSGSRIRIGIKMSGSKMAGRMEIIETLAETISNTTASSSRRFNASVLINTTSNGEIGKIYSVIATAG